MGANFLSGPPAPEYGGVHAVADVDASGGLEKARESDGTEYLVAIIVASSLAVLVLLNKGGFKAMAAVNVGG